MQVSFVASGEFFSLAFPSGRVSGLAAAGLPGPAAVVFVYAGMNVPSRESVARPRCAANTLARLRSCSFPAYIRSCGIQQNGFDTYRKESRCRV